MFMVILLFGEAGIVMLGDAGAVVVAGTVVVGWGVSMVLLIWSHSRYKSGQNINTTIIAIKVNPIHHGLRALLWSPLSKKRDVSRNIGIPIIRTIRIYPNLKRSLVKLNTPTNIQVAKKSRVPAAARAVIPSFCFFSGFTNINPHPWKNRDMARAVTDNAMPYKAKSFDIIFNPFFFALHNRDYQNACLVSTFIGECMKGES
jgi:hypothetical protein